MKTELIAARCVRRSVIALGIAAVTMLPLAQAQNLPADPPPSSASKASTRSALDERQVPFEELKNRIGQRIIIRTTNHTVRSGILNAYAINMLDITTDKDQGGFALSVPRDNVQSVSILLEPVADPLFPTTGKPGAKKN